MEEFNAEKELKNLREKRKIQRKSKRYLASKLNKYGFQILALYCNGANTTEIHAWLLTNTKIKVARTTVYRWIKKHDQD
ncbi:hypothetical protein [Vibrio superstes]|uniref:Uncharacterized protein n=1 Tax=Vibrio superstes NBRC 103154 TaxID=1219062 RepID=A0A511QKK3_9VIBR|nr:hypothetical protein [Vibrio superstes]GEM77850.1 hypothetical protein VSU01S_00950 [Vibrio superstes NBRC 103154]